MQCFGRYLRLVENIYKTQCYSKILNLQATREYSRFDREWTYRNLPKKDDGTAGEQSVDVDPQINRESMFPDETTSFKLFDGVPFNQLPICDITASKNNTKITVANSAGLVQLLRTCGSEGFKTAKKGTNIAAQATAVSISAAAIKRGIKTVRVRVSGLGPGRMSAIKGLQLGGINIVSITDATRVSSNPPRPRKAKRL